MTTQAPKTAHGSLGTAFLVNPKPDRPDQEATLRSWFLRIPSAHPFWSCYMLSAIHLRDIEGVRPALKRFPEASHEFLVIALNAERNPDPEKPESWQHLTPVNVVEQVGGATDEQVVEVTDLLAKAAVDGVLLVEPQGIFGARDSWARSIRKTLEHVAAGKHMEAGEA